MMRDDSRKRGSLERIDLYLSRNNSIKVDGGGCIDSQVFLEYTELAIEFLS